MSGQTIANKYLVEGILGRGAMGVVLAARHLDLRHLVAIKVLSGDVSELKTARERFLREARVAARMHSPHICRVLDTGALDDGTPFFVMEYLDGVDLADELRRRGRLELSEAVGYIRQACEALTVAHAAGVVHRDLKPANLFLLRRSGSSRLLKVLDFGVSKALLDHGLTSTATLVGSPLYMSPEQLDCARDVDARSDLWSLGAILYELLTGEVPFNGNTLAQVVTAIVQREPASLAAHGISVPSGLEDVLRRTLSKGRLQRYGSAAELSQALAPYGPARPDNDVSVSRWSESVERERETLDETGVPGPAPEPFLAALRKAMVTSQPAQAPRSPRRRRWQLTALASCLLLAAALVALWPSGAKHAPAVVETQSHAAVALAVDAGAAPPPAAVAPPPEEKPPLPEGKSEPAAPPVQPKAAPPPEAPREQPVRSVRPVVPVDPLEIPGFGGRH